MSQAGKKNHDLVAANVPFGATSRHATLHAGCAPPDPRAVSPSELRVPQLPHAEPPRAARAPPEAGYRFITDSPAWLYFEQRSFREREGG
jgi:hypothetical protein